MKKEEPKQDLEKEMFELEQELNIPSNLRWHNSKPKQETLKEVVEKRYNHNDNKLSMAQKISFMEGAKWQQERMYSEESECVNMYLDDLKIPRKSEDGQEYSIVGRIKQLEKKYLKQLSEVENYYLQQFKNK